MRLPSIAFHAAALAAIALGLSGCLAAAVVGTAAGVAGAAAGVAGSAVGGTVHVGHMAVNAATGGGKSDKSDQKGDR
ncbi:MAG: hypothetical protein JWP50_151 [Phenylobacterium sp.]|nr:hypothetical protein [Phenylobacterium sp.]